MPSRKENGRRVNGKTGGGWITKTRRLAVYLRDGFTCIYCLADLHGADPRDITLDHIEPKVNGRNHHESNLITACRCCNSKRQDLPLSRFAGPETRKHIRRNARRSLKPYVAHAKAILSGAAAFTKENVSE
jgi:5-methylcytosine-specific restriction endonuclease McrA